MPIWKHFSLNGETTNLDDRLRSKDPDHFIKLPDGFTYYETAGPLSGPPVVFINGFSIPVYLWEHTFLPLAEAGMRVMRFDLFGRGFSDRPNINYGPDLYDRQLLNLLQILNFKTPINLIGSSMGGIVSSIFTDRHPELVDKLILIDPAGMMEPSSHVLSILNYPIIGEIILGLFGEKLLLPVCNKIYYIQKFILNMLATTSRK
jgi:pimeloyl-ACP methyl ester carboxylesterase